MSKKIKLCIVAFIIASSVGCSLTTETVGTVGKHEMRAATGVLVEK